VNPSALDRTAAWLMNVPYIEQESETELCRDEHTQAEKVTDHPHTQQQRWDFNSCKHTLDRKWIIILQ